MNSPDPSLMVSCQEEREEARLLSALRAGEDSAYEELVRLRGLATEAGPPGTAGKTALSLTNSVGPGGPGVTAG